MSENLKKPFSSREDKLLIAQNNVRKAHAHKPNDNYVVTILYLTDCEEKFKSYLEELGGLFDPGESSTNTCFGSVAMKPNYEHWNSVFHLPYLIDIYLVIYSKS